MNVLTFLANSGLMASSFRGYRQWSSSIQQVEKTQRNVLHSIVERNAETDFGIRHGFGAICSVSDFQRQVPIRTYADFIPYIERIVGGEQGVLTADPVSRFEQSSGSTSASKLIPYTSSLRSEFQQGLNPWLCSLYASHPTLLTGKQYWSVTPVGQKQLRTLGGIPIGFEEDAEYFGPLKRTFIQNLMAVPSAVSRISDIETFRYVTVLFLLKCRDLTFISVWNPTFLMLLLNEVASRMDDLIADIANGTITTHLDPSVRSELGKLCADPNRAKELKTVLLGTNGDVPWQAIWPKLSLISCWADASAAHYAMQLRNYFPTVAIQPKGLLATEGFITFPIASGQAPALSINSHFFEFAKVAEFGEVGTVKLASELELGSRYTVLITTGGGLYRYRLDDIVETVGFVGDRCPTFRFIGKAGSVVDLFGEKLNECYVRTLLDEATGSLGINPAFAMVAPEENNGCPARYTLFVQFNEPREEELAGELAKRIESGLRENYHYQYCRQLGQLAALGVCLIPSKGRVATEQYINTCTLLGQRLGNIKPTALHGYNGWRDVFLGKSL